MTLSQVQFAADVHCTCYDAAN